MEWFEYLIIALCVIFVLSVIIVHFLLKRKGKSLTGDCTGNCGCCNHACSCKNKKELIEEYKKFNS